jgi:hypothetical protein
MNSLCLLEDLQYGVSCVCIYIYVSRGTEELSFCVRVFCSGSLIIMDEFDPTSVPRETIKYAYLPCYFQVNVIVSFWFVFIICRSTYVQFLLERMPAEVEALLSSTAIGKDDHTGLEISSHELLDFDPKVAQLTLLHPIRMLPVFDEVQLTARALCLLAVSL